MAGAADYRTIVTAALLWLTKRAAAPLGPSGEPMYPHVPQAIDRQICSSFMAQPDELEA